MRRKKETKNPALQSSNQTRKDVKEKKMLERCGRGVCDIQRGRESELDYLS